MMDNYEWLKLFYLVSQYITGIIDSEESGFFQNLLKDQKQNGIKLSIELTNEIFNSGIDIGNEEEMSNWLEIKNSGR